MAKRKVEWSEKKIQQYIKDGRGTGRGLEYKPWLTNQDFSSTGRTVRSTGMTIERAYFCASGVEYEFFLLLDWADEVVDIFDQFPLLPLESTLAIAEAQQIPHPKDRKSKVDTVLSTDFVFEVQEGFQRRLVARTVKPVNELTKRVIEKFEIERRYWLERNVDWGIVTENDLPKMRVKNLLWFHNDYYLEGTLIPYENYILETIDRITPFIAELQQLKLTDACIRADQQFRLNPGESLRLTKHLVSRKLVKYDIDQHYGPDLMIRDIDFTAHLDQYKTA
ncbi:MAG: TnsA endonuclease N-terminal domain-containing protein [Hahellaceae bacterium]|nr:TnsA endonuclease N-terminal domain-containing protein [Hahellaceae bacterium]MCP5210033.1 TnsA endonuclease N-terminal domain-containing protein [Hahellaceae bacterium]